MLDRLRVELFLSTFPRRERRFDMQQYHQHYRYFYPRSHVGNDRSSSCLHSPRKYFYPRSHVGNDQSSSPWMRFHLLFLSTFPRRERHCELSTSPPLERFLSTFPRRERLGYLALPADSRYFYPRSHVGNDVIMAVAAAATALFLSTFPRRERPS